MIRTLLFAALPLLAAAETPYLSTPVLGYIFDETGGAIRQISGVPGAASLDQAVAAGTALDAAWVHSGARVAVAVTKDARTAVVNWRGEDARLTELETGLASIAGVAFSASGDRAALTDGGTVEIWAGLLSEPHRTASHAVGGVTAAAVSAEGVAVATGSFLALLDQEQALAGTGWSALAYSGGDLFAASGTQVVRIGANGASTVVGSLTGPALAVAVSRNGGRVAVALEGSVVLFDLNGGAAVVVDCECSASRLEALEGNLVVHLAGAEGGPKVLDADAAEPRVLEFGGIAQ